MNAMAGRAAERADSVSLRILRRQEQLRQELLQLQERHRACWERCIRTGQASEGERVSASRNIHGQEDTLAALADMEQKIQETREQLAAATDAAETLLNRLESMPGILSYRNALVLRLRYLNGVTWSEMCAALRRSGFPAVKRTVMNWYHSALKQLESLQCMQ